MPTAVGLKYFDSMDNERMWRIGAHNVKGLEILHTLMLSGVRLRANAVKGKDGKLVSDETKTALFYLGFAIVMLFIASRCTFDGGSDNDYRDCDAVYYQSGPVCE